MGIKQGFWFLLSWGGKFEFLKMGTLGSGRGGCLMIENFVFVFAYSVLTTSPGKHTLWVCGRARGARITVFVSVIFGAMPRQWLH